MPFVDLWTMPAGKFNNYEMTPLSTLFCLNNGVEKSVSKQVVENL